MNCYYPYTGRPHNRNLGGLTVYKLYWGKIDPVSYHRSTDKYHADEQGRTSLIEDTAVK